MLNDQVSRMYSEDSEVIFYKLPFKTDPQILGALLPEIVTI